MDSPETDLPFLELLTGNACISVHLAASFSKTDAAYQGSEGSSQQLVLGPTEILTEGCLPFCWRLGVLV